MRQDERLIEYLAHRFEIRPRNAGRKPTLRNVSERDADTVLLISQARNRIGKREMSAKAVVEKQNHRMSSRRIDVLLAEFEEVDGGERFEGVIGPSKPELSKPEARGTQRQIGQAETEHCPGNFKTGRIRRVAAGPHRRIGVSPSLIAGKVFGMHFHRRIECCVFGVCPYSVAIGENEYRPQSEREPGNDG